MNSKLIMFLTFISLLIFWLIPACNPPTYVNPNNSFAELFPNIPMNEQIQLQVPNEIAGEPSDILLLLINNTTNEIKISNANGKKILVFRDGVWKETSNLLNYHGEWETVFGKENSNYPNIIDIIFHPDLTQLVHVKTIRIVVIGYMNNGSATGSSEQPVGAYIDLNIKDFEKYLR